MVEIPLAELRFHFVRSSGPGGQHVNKAATQVELAFDVLASPSLNDEQKARVLRRLASYIDPGGILRLTSQATRSQLRNRQEVTARFRRLMADALRPLKKRRPTRPTAAAHERRLKDKRKRGEVKRGRGRGEGDE